MSDFNADFNADFGSEIQAAVPGAGMAAGAGIAPQASASAVAAPGHGSAAGVGLPPSVSVAEGVTASPGAGSAAGAGIAPAVAVVPRPIGVCGFPLSLATGGPGGAPDYAAAFAAMQAAGITEFMPMGLYEEIPAPQSTEYELDFYPPSVGGTADASFYQMIASYGLKLILPGSITWPSPSALPELEDDLLKAVVDASVSATGSSIVAAVTTIDEPVMNGWADLPTMAGRLDAIYSRVAAVEAATGTEIPVIMVNASLPEALVTAAGGDASAAMTAYLGHVASAAAYCDRHGWSIYYTQLPGSGVRAPSAPTVIETSQAAALADYYAWSEANLAVERTGILQANGIADLFSDAALAEEDPEQVALSQAPSAAQMTANIAALGNCRQLVWFGASYLDDEAGAWPDVLQVSAAESGLWLAIPGPGAAAGAGSVPLVAASVIAAPAAGAASGVGHAPAVSVTSGVTATPAAGAAAGVGIAPSVAATAVAVPAAGSGSGLGHAPSVAASAGVAAAPAAGAAVGGGHAPGVSATTSVAAMPAAGAGLGAGRAPAASATVIALPAAGAGVGAGQAPTAVTGLAPAQFAATGMWRHRGASGDAPATIISPCYTADDLTIDITVHENGAPKDITFASPVALFERWGEVVVAEVILSAPTNGVLRVTLPEDSLTPGVWNLHVRLVIAGETQTVYVAELTVHQSLSAA